MAIITQDMDLETAWKEVMNHLTSAAKQPHHSFRYFDFATLDVKQTPVQRTVVLREFDGNTTFSFYTDRRSDKVEHIQHNPAVSMLFYDADQKLQVRIQGKASILPHEKKRKKLWEESGSRGAHSYTSEKSPGKIIQKPRDAFDWNLEDPRNFCVIYIEAHRFEFLQLDGHKHLRSSRVLQSGTWQTYWMVP